MHRDKQKEESRKRKLATFKETGNWPGAKKAKSRKPMDSVPWSKIKEKTAMKKEKKAGIADRKSKTLSDSEMQLLEKAFSNTGKS